MTSARHLGLAPLLLLAAAKAFAAPAVDAATFLRSNARYADGVHVTGVQADGATVAFDLRRFEVFARDAQLVIDDGHGNVQRLPRPATRYYTGRVAGTDGGAVFLAVEPDGRARGIVDRSGSAALINGNATQALRLAPVDTSAPRTGGEFHCDADDLAQARSMVEKAHNEAPPQQAGGNTRPYRARAAIETDYEFFQKFNNGPAAIAYVGDLIGFASTKYLAETDTRLEVVYVRLWSTADDPWTNELSANCALYGFGTYWNANMTGVSRSFAHMLSARQTSGGSAWIGALCSAPFTVNLSAGSCNFGSGALSAGGDYGYTGRLRGDFVAGSPQVLWDSEAPAHEIGHTFSSPHTHCYNGIGGNPDPIDHCSSSETNCYAGATSLPGPAGQGSGTIMSYCHLIPPGMSNISMTFGTGHAYGTAPGRVAARMSSYVANLAQTNPACVVDDTIFADGFD